ncbi:MAG: hypothetical protein CM15mP100_3430 [Alphaproteobacteria bacterium]|nr:MAG: hypothetical protein CM15mP100_3430 [Alphaproteobacteria bacterium]
MGPFWGKGGKGFLGSFKILVLFFLTLPQIPLKVFRVSFPRVFFLGF